LGLVNDILDFDRLETGRMAVKVEPCDLAEKLEDVAALLGGLVADQRVKLDLQVDKRPMPIRTDPLKATQILLNIISNAAKFTPQGGTILVRLFRSQNSDDLVYECRDNGIGISDDQMALIMSSVGRTDSALTSKGGGVGLGLPITKQLVELLNGEFDIKSQEGKGTTVTIRFRDLEAQQSQNAA
jgi:two-component system cell cycle sensor histidine kinase PleC